MRKRPDTAEDRMEGALKAILLVPLLGVALIVTVLVSVW